MEEGETGSAGWRHSYREFLFWGLTLFLALLFWLAADGRHGVWQDEALTLYQVRLSFPEILANRIPVAQFDTQNTVPPFYFLTLAAWGRALGFNLWSLRLFSIFCALLVALLLYRVGSWMGGRGTGRVAALLAVLSPLYLWYAQELRMYTFLLVPVTLSFGILWRWYLRSERGEAGRRAGWRLPLAYALVAAAMVWSHYLAFLMLGAQLLWLTLVLLRRRPALLLALGGALLLLSLPLIPFGLRRLASGPERDFHFIPLTSIVNDALHALSFGLPYFMSKTEEVAFLFPLAWLLIGLGLWQAWRRGSWPLLWLLGGGLIFPVLALFALSLIKPLYQNARHLIMISPAFYLLWAFGLVRLAEFRRWLPLLLIPLLAYGWLLPIHRYFTAAEPLKNDVQPLFEYLGAHYIPGDVVVLNDPVLQHAIEYFAPGVPWTVLPPYALEITAETEQRYEEVAQAYDRLWYVYGPPDTTFDTWEHVYEWFSTHHRRIGYVEFPGQTEIGAAYFDTQGAVIQYEPHPAAQPMEVLFAETIRFMGLYQPLDPVQAGRRLVVESLWWTERQPKRDYEFVLRLTDHAGQVWYQQQFPPLGGLHRTPHWLEGQRLRMPIFVTLPEALTPGTYRLELYLTSEGQAIFPEGSEQPLLLDELVVEPGRAGAGQKGARLGDSLRLLRPPLPETLPPAALLPLRLQLLVTGQGRLPDSFVLDFTDPTGELARSISLPLLAGLPVGPDGAPQFPPEVWQPGDRLTLQYSVRLPPELEGSYRLSLAALQGEERLPVREGWGLLPQGELPLGTVEIEARMRRVEVPPLDHEVGESWPDTARLLGYLIRPEQPAAGEPFHLQLVWQARAPTPQPIKVFLHVVDETGQFVTAADAFFDVPSVAWREGEILLSDHQIGGDLAPGRYTLLVGLYEEASGARVAVDAPDNALSIGTLEVAP